VGLRHVKSIVCTLDFDEHLHHEQTLLCIYNLGRLFEPFFEILVLLIGVFGFYSIMLTCLQVPTNFKLKYFFSVRILGEILIVHEPNYCDAFESNNMGAKKSCMPSFELQTLSPPLFFDVDFEDLQPLETFATTKDGHAHNSKKQKKTKI